MRRLVVFDAYPHDLGGSHRLIARLAEAMPAHGWTVKAAFPAEGAAVDFLRGVGVATDVLAAPDSLRHYGGTTTGARTVRAVASLPSYWNTGRRYLRDQADAVVANDPRGLFLAGPAARAARRPLLWWIHAWPPGAFRHLARPVSLIANGAVASSASLLEMSIRPGTVAAPSVELPAVPAAPDLTLAPLITCVARLHPQKGIDTLVAAAGLLRQRGLTHRVVVVGATGGDDTERRIRGSIDELGLTDTFVLDGEVPDVGAVLATSTVYVQSSRSAEGFGMATLEAMAHALPVVVTDVGGLRELVGDVGVVVPPEDPAALADAISSLLDDPVRRAALGSAARARAASFTVESWSAQLASALERAVSRK